MTSFLVLLFVEYTSWTTQPIPVISHTDGMILLTSRL